VKYADNRRGGRMASDRGTTGFARARHGHAATTLPRLLHPKSRASGAVAPVGRVGLSSGATTRGREGRADPITLTLDASRLDLSRCRGKGC
jgi:hypothetical protein